MKCVLLQLLLRRLCDQSCTIKKHKMLPLCPFPGSQGKASGPITSCSQSPSLWVPLLALCSHLITFQWRHAALFIAEWCFFIRLCLFVALRSTEGFLPADVSSATLQKDGENVSEEGEKRKADRKESNDKKEGIGLEDAWHQGVGMALHEIFRREVTRFISVCRSKFREQSMWLLLSSSPVM